MVRGYGLRVVTLSDPDVKIVHSARPQLDVITKRKENSNARQKCKSIVVPPFQNSPA